MVCVVQEISPPPSPHLVSNHILCDLSGFSHSSQFGVAVPVAGSLAFNRALGVVTQWASDPLWKVKIYKQSVLQAQDRAPVYFLNLTLVIQQLFSPPSSILCHSSRNRLGTYQLLCVCFTLSLQRHARRLKSCFYSTNRPNYSANYGIEVSLLFPKLCALFLNAEALWDRAVGLPSSVSCWLYLPAVVPGSTLGLWWGQNGDTASLGETPRDQIVAQRTQESGFVPNQI